jgi:hypothetical protein
MKWRNLTYVELDVILHVDVDVTRGVAVLRQAVKTEGYAMCVCEQLLSMMLQPLAELEQWKSITGILGPFLYCALTSSRPLSPYDNACRCEPRDCNR